MATRGEHRAKRPVRPPTHGWRDRIAEDEGVLSGKPVVRGTRISVELVVDLLGRGYSVAQVIEQYPHLAELDIRACLAYASDVLKSERVYTLR